MRCFPFWYIYIYIYILFQFVFLTICQNTILSLILVFGYINLNLGSVCFDVKYLLSKILFKENYLSSRV